MQQQASSGESEMIGMAVAPIALGGLAIVGVRFLTFMGPGAAIAAGTQRLSFEFTTAPAKFGIRPEFRWGRIYFIIGSAEADYTQLPSG
ncbi:hypothetical protein ACWEO2_11695 [Nocardia sp. NPDC004278]